MGALREYLFDPLRKNALYLMANTVSISVLGVVFWFVAARTISDAELGLASSLISVIGLLAALASLGLGMGFIRYLPQEDGPGRSALINSVLLYSSLFAVLVTVVFAAGAPLWTPKMARLVLSVPVLIFLIVLVVSRLASIFQNTIFIAFRSSKYVLLKETFLFNLLKLALLPFLAFLGASGVLVSWGGGVIVSLVASFFILSYKFGYTPSLRVDTAKVGGILSFSLGNYVAGLLASMPGFLLPVIFLNRIGPEAAGYFYIAWMIGGILFTLVSDVCTSLFAEGSNEVARLSHFVRKTTNFLLLLVVPSILLVWFLGDKILLIFGSGFSEDGSALLRILALSSLPVMAVSIYVAIKRVKKRVGEMIALNVIIAGGTLASAYLLAPQYGVMSAGIGWMASHLAALAFIGAEMLVGRARGGRGRVDGGGQPR